MSELSEMLRRHEGVRSKPYKDTVGKLTIGVGRNLDDVGLSDDEIDYLLHNDIHYYRAELRKVYPWFMILVYPRQDALTNLAFNLGMAGFAKFKHLIAAMEKGDSAKAAEEMMASNWAKQVGQRAFDLAQMMRTGEYL